MASNNGLKKSHRERKNGASREQWEKAKKVGRPKQRWIMGTAQLTEEGHWEKVK